ncbi:ABC transporter permease [Photobacterium sp. 1_MG-2023]|uniref:ABC transporter permease n=1 Tax=Photobacterium sp. 1_MG-2023 TaxID=3062646 RepID=UPI0026E32490|nr:ABC transporter permease [Photobacterium sp. 1_MG-2023]MDO6707021.1 ABC transporter permease [Photobacterium sp. 1_MG-2023]
MWLTAIKRECSIIRQEPWLKAMLFFLPAALFVLMWWIFSYGIARDLPVGVVDLDQSRLSRGLVRYYDASPTLSVARQLNSVEEGSALLRHGEIYALAIIPESMEAETFRGQSPTVTVFYNTQFILIAKLVNSAFVSAQTTYTAGIDALKHMASGTAVPIQALGQALPIRNQITPLFNSNAHYGQFLVSAAIPAMWQIFMIATTVLALAAEQRRQGLHVWLNQQPVQQLCAKLAVYGVLYLIQGILFLWGLYGLLGWPMHGSWGILLLAQILMVFACLSMGTMLFFLTLDATRTMSLVAGFTAPAFAFMGITFPATDMPVLAAVWRALLPVTHYIEIQVQQVDYGNHLQQAMPQMFALMCFVVAFALGILRMQSWRRKQQEVLG